MRIAVICLAYLQDPAGVQWLGDYCSRIPAELLVHVDAKVSDAAYRAVASRTPSVTLASRRYPIWWGGFNTIRAVIAALQELRRRGQWDRILLLTEDTVPLLGPAEMAAHLGQDAEFLASYPVPTDPSNAIYRRYHDFYFFDSAPTNPRIFEPTDCAVKPGHLAELGRLAAAMARGKADLPNLRHGAGWWGLTSDAVSAILTSYETDSAIRESFEFSAIPEEQYVHTILARAGWTRRCHPFVHADFNRPPHPYVYSDRAEIEGVRGGPTCMLRKVDLGAAGVREYMQSLLVS